MRISAGVAGLSIASSILFFVACSSDDAANPGGEDDGDGGKSSSGQSSGGTSGQSSGGTSGQSSSGEDPDPPVPVGDGSLGAGCNKDDECDSKICAVGHKCVLSPSCRGSSRKGDAPGIDTCGAAEPGDESCCTSLTLPKTTARTLDKFEITAGRIRAFISSLPDGNLRKWAKDYAAANPSSELGQMATNFPGYIDTFPDHADASTDNPLLEAAWPKNNADLIVASTVQNFCNTYAGGDPGNADYCNRDQPATADAPADPRPGTLLFKGPTPLVATVGASFEGHIGYGENYFASSVDDEKKLQGYGFPAHFQYGKVGGRCARVK